MKSTCKKLKHNRKKSIPLDLEQLKTRCLATEESFHALGEVIDTPDGPLVYIDNGADVLAVAHLDYVNGNLHFCVSKLKGQTVVYCTRLDDRLGAYIILDLLPSLGVKCDVLLTTGEEIGRSTAAHFVPRKAYNWVFEFDRRGTEAVLYQYEDAKTVNILEDNGFRVGWGSFSDISSLEHLGVKCINFGTGYYEEHFKGAHFYPVDTWHSVRLFVKFFNRYNARKLPHAAEKPKRRKGKSKNGSGQKWWDVPEACSPLTAAEVNDPFHVGGDAWADAWDEYAVREDYDTAEDFQFSEEQDRWERFRDTINDRYEDDTLDYYPRRRGRGSWRTVE
jgi:hypothetical protein